MKLSELVNLEVEIEKQGMTGYAVFSDNKLKRRGRVIDWKRPAEEEGNFESAEQIAGKKNDELTWTKDALSSTWTKSHSFLIKGEYVRFTDLQLDKLKEAVGVNQWGKPSLPAKVTPFMVSVGKGTTIDFRVVEDKEQEKIPDENVGFGSEPEVADESLPF